MKKKALITSLALLLVAIVCLSTATYAWFTAGTSAKAQGFKLYTHATGGLLISKTGNADSFKSTEDYAKATTDSLDPTSTTDLANWVTADAADADNYAKASDGSYSLVAAANLDSYRLKEPIYFKSTTGVAKNVYLKSITLKDDNGDSYADDPMYSNTLRVAFGTVSVTNDVETVTLSRVYTYRAISAQNPVTGVAYDSSTTTFTPDTAVTSSQATGSVSPSFGQAATSVNGTKYYVYMWFEGEDPACKSTNAYSLEDLSVALEFDGADVTP
jgi:hypothetical protein